MTADDPGAPFWTKALWFAETITASGPLIARKREIVLRGLICNPCSEGRGEAPASSERLRLACALHALATEFDNMPPVGEELPIVVTANGRRLLFEQFETAEAALDATTALCRKKAVEIDEERTDAEILRGHLERRAKFNRTGRTKPIPE